MNYPGGRPVERTEFRGFRFEEGHPWTSLFHGRRPGPPRDLDVYEEQMVIPQEAESQESAYPRHEKREGKSVEFKRRNNQI